MDYVTINNYTDDKLTCQKTDQKDFGGKVEHQTLYCNQQEWKQRIMIIDK